MRGGRHLINPVILSGARRAQSKDLTTSTGPPESTPKKETGAEASPAGAHHLYAPIVRFFDSGFASAQNDRASGI